MSKPFVLIILFNVILGVLFVFSNYRIWDTVNQLPYTSPSWGPMDVHYVPRFFVNGEFILEQRVVLLFNYPFWLFWIAMIGNLVLMALILGKQKKQYTSMR